MSTVVITRLGSSSPPLYPPFAREDRNSTAAVHTCVVGSDGKPNFARGPAPRRYVPLTKEAGGVIILVVPGDVEVRVRSPLTKGGYRGFWLRSLGHNLFVKHSQVSLLCRNPKTT